MLLTGRHWQSKGTCTSKLLLTGHVRIDDLNLAPEGTEGMTVVLDSDTSVHFFKSENAIDYLKLPESFRDPKYQTFIILKFLFHGPVPPFLYAYDAPLPHQVPLQTSKDLELLYAAN